MMGMENRITELKENLDQQRNKELKRLLILFVLWTVWLAITPRGVGFNASDPYPLQLLKIVFLVMGVILLVSSVILIKRLFLLQKRIWSNHELREMVDDDIVRIAWLRAAAVGFCSMLSAEIIFTISGLFLINSGGIDTPAAWRGTHGPIVIAIGIVTVVSAFLYFRRD